MTSPTQVRGVWSLTAAILSLVTLSGPRVSVGTCVGLTFR